jgi:hypothetical protein
MTAQLVVANATISATNLNPTVFSEMWLAKNQIIPAGEGHPGSIFTDVLVQAQATDFWILVLPQQLQFMPRTLSVPSDLARERIGRIVTLLPHVPYVAVGLNFVWHSEIMAEMGRVVRRLFGSGGPPLDRFGAPDARFGIYASKEVGVARLRLNVLPIYDRVNPTVERLQFVFNFERLLDKDQDKPAMITDVVGHWDEYRTVANEMVDATLEAASR